MTVVFIGLGLATFTEILLFWKPLWRFRAYLVPGLMGGLALFCGALMGLSLSFWTLLFSLLCVYRIINLLRIHTDRIHADYLYFASRQTSLWLIGSQGLIILLAELINALHINVLSLIYILTALITAASLVLLITTRRHLKTTLPPGIKSGLADRDLPTLTVAIPARNETTDLEACLTSLLANTYPKLEILVLDDCSQDKRTPEVIRDFAHDGVRFIAGTPPPGQWLAKNHAYAQLADNANGEILLFCGVDTRFEAASLINLVKIMLQKQKTMMSILPANVLPRPRNVLALCIQPARYAWELTLPRRMLDRPPVLSTCWLINRAALKQAGGFAAVSRKCIPESYFARNISRDNDGYSFMQSDKAIGISCVKTLDEQKATAIRTRYPQMHRRPEMVALIAFAEFGVLLWPVILLIAAILAQAWLLAALAVFINIVNFSTYSAIITLTYRQFNWPSLFILPLGVIYDLGILHYSMWQYEFHEVIWKDRNVCVPIMRTYAKLPPLP